VRWHGEPKGKRDVEGGRLGKHSRTVDLRKDLVTFETVRRRRLVEPYLKEGVRTRMIDREKASARITAGLRKDYIMEG